jgi:hypothetical protein
MEDYPPGTVVYWLAEFAQALIAEDELGVVVRAHIYIESAIDQFLSFELHDYSQLGRIDYSMKVRIALACGLPSDFGASLRALGTLRNKFAHRLGTKLTESDVDSFCGTFPSKEREAIELKLRDAGMSPQESALKKRLRIYVMSLWVAIVFAPRPPPKS